MVYYPKCRRYPPYRPSPKAVRFRAVVPACDTRTGFPVRPRSSVSTATGPTQLRADPGISAQAYASSPEISTMPSSHSISHAAQDSSSFPLYYFHWDFPSRLVLVNVGQRPLSCFLVCNARSGYHCVGLFRRVVSPILDARNYGYLREKSLASPRHRLSCPKTRTTDRIV